MTDMVERVREIANELPQDRARILSDEQLINLSAIILTLLDVVETIPEKARWVDVHGNVCFDNDTMRKLADALTILDSRIAEILEGAE